jgi:alpha-beta hydrolase superfamily lysophospholipase
MGEIIEIKNLLGKTLVGDFYQSNDKSKDRVVVLVHGFMSSRSRTGKYDELAERLISENINVFNFDLSGYGDSDLEEISVSSGVLDLRCILSYIRYQGYQNIGVVGHSLGGIITLKQSLDKLKSICLLAPVTDKINYEFKDRFGQEKVDEMHKNGFMRVTDKQNRVFDVSEKMVSERKDVNQRELMENVKIPCFLIHGTKDKVIPVEHSKKAFKFLTGIKKIEIIEGESHSLGLSLEKINKFVVDWFVKTL